MKQFVLVFMLCILLNAITAPEVRTAKKKSRNKSIRDNKPNLFWGNIGSDGSENGSFLSDPINNVGMNNINKGSDAVGSDAIGYGGIGYGSAGYGGVGYGGVSYGGVRYNGVGYDGVGNNQQAPKDRRGHVIIGNVDYGKSANGKVGAKSKKCPKLEKIEEAVINQGAVCVNKQLVYMTYPYNHVWMNGFLIIVNGYVACDLSKGVLYLQSL